MRRRPPDDRANRRGAVLATALVLFACGSPDLEARPSPLAAAAADRANTAPRILRLALEPAAPAPGEAVRAVVDVLDADGDPVKMTYEWSLEGRPVGGGMPKLALHDAARGDRLEVAVVASDGRDDSEPALVSVALADRPPVIDRLLLGPALEISAGTDVTVAPEARDADGDALTFRHSWTVNGEAVDAEGERFETGALSTGDTLAVEVRASDGFEESDPFASPPIRIVNQPPRVVSRPGPSEPGQGFRYVVHAEDPDGDQPLHFELGEAPRGMQIDATSGEVTWTPERQQSGTHRVEVVVDDLHGGRVAHGFDVAVGQGPAAAAEH